MQKKASVLVSGMARTPEAARPSEALKKMARDLKAAECGCEAGKENICGY
jgi:hypothetical protein